MFYISSHSSRVLTRSFLYSSPPSLLLTLLPAACSSICLLLAILLNFDLFLCVSVSIMSFITTDSPPLPLSPNTNIFNKQYWKRLVLASSFPFANQLIDLIPQLLSNVRCSLWRRIHRPIRNESIDPLIYRVPKCKEHSQASILNYPPSE